MIGCFRIPFILHAEHKSKLNPSIWLFLKQINKKKKKKQQQKDTSVFFLKSSVTEFQFTATYATAELQDNYQNTE